jgi:hypothetical protein
MSISKLNVVTSGAGASSITVPLASTNYSATLPLNPAVYSVTCASTVIAKVVFMTSETAVVATATTASGTVTINLPTAVNRVKLWIESGTDIPVTFTKLAEAVAPVAVTGTLDTITTTSTYTTTSTSGYAYVMAAGGGAGGAGGGGGGGAGGGSGGAGASHIALTGSLPITIGAAGSGGAGGGQNGTDGGTTTFSEITANGGKSPNNAPNGYGGGGAGGTATGGTWNVPGNNAPSSPGEVNGFPGGTSATANSAIIAAGYARSSGGKGGNQNSAGSAGLGGVVYVLRY